MGQVCYMKLKRTEVSQAKNLLIEYQRVTNRFEFKVCCDATLLKVLSKLPDLYFTLVMFWKTLSIVSLILISCKICTPFTEHRSSTD